MDLDIRTLTFLLGVTNVLQVVIIYFHYLINKSYPGIRCWLAGFSSLAIGALLILGREIPGFEPLSIVLSNIFLFSGLFLLYIGCMRFFGKQIHFPLFITIMLFCQIGIFYFAFIDNNLYARIIIFSTTAAFMCFMSGYHVLRFAPREFALSARFISVIFFSYFVFYIMRIFLTINTPPVGTFFDSSAGQLGTMLSSFLEAILLPFGFINMVNQRSSLDRKMAETYFQSLFDTSPDAILVTTLDDGTILECNTGFSELTGFSREEALGKRSVDIQLWQNPDDRHTLLSELHKKAVCHNLEISLQKKNGEPFFGLLSAKLFTYNTTPCIISVTIDISERRRAELKILEAEQKSTALAMAITANHEINQPLSVIQGAFGLLAKKIEPTPDNNKHIHTINGAIDTIETILKKMRDIEKYETILFRQYLGNSTMVDLTAHKNTNNE